MITCKICGKSLTDPISVLLEIGPICRMKGKEKEYSMKNGNLFSNRSEFTYAVSGNILWIKDLGGMKSVTNDIENVIADIIKELAIEGKKIIYRDSMGIWDEVRCLVESGKVKRVSFHSIGEKDMQKAMFAIQHKQTT